MPPPPEDDPPSGVVAFRLGAIEKRMDGFERSVYQRLDAMQGKLDALAFVRKDVFDESVRRIEDAVHGATSRLEARMQSAEKVAASAHTIAMWALGTVGALIALLGALVVALKATGA